MHIDAKKYPENHKKMYIKLLLLLLTFSSVNNTVKSQENAVKEVITKLFDGMRSSDAEKLKSVFAPGAILQTISKNKEGQIIVRSDLVDSFILQVTKPHDQVYDERITFEMIRIDDNLASVWTPYQFYVGDKFSHCGVNSFQLVKQQGQWKIQYLIDTRRRENCN
jgi:hypothetical protein